MSIETTPVELASLADERAAGFGLEAPFYTSPEIYEQDLDLIFGQHWIFAVAEAEIPDPGDYVTVDLGRHSVIVVRDDDENVRAFRNVCRHRGSRLLESGCGSIGNIVCPYHQWTYRVDGSLIFAESQADTFEYDKFGLKPVNVRAVGGLVFLCLADEPPADFDEVSDLIEPYLKPYGLASAKIAHQTDIVEEGNWKLVMENNRECHHCDASHPELLTAYFPISRYEAEDVPPRLQQVFERYLEAQAELEKAREVIGFPNGDVCQLEGKATGFQISHLPLDGAGASFGPDGQQLCAKLMGSIEDPRFGDLSLHMQPNSWFHFLGDHAVVFSVIPLAVDRTLVRTTWLVNPEAVEGVDYSVESLTSVWRATNDQDRVLVEGTQRGVTDPGYVPGPYSEVEGEVDAFVTWYVQRIQANA